MSNAYFRPFCVGLNALPQIRPVMMIKPPQNKPCSCLMGLCLVPVRDWPFRCSPEFLRKVGNCRNSFIKWILIIKYIAGLASRYWVILPAFQVHLVLSDICEWQPVYPTDTCEIDQVLSARAILMEHRKGIELELREQQPIKRGYM